jgi:hypothetical protein
MMGVFIKSMGVGWEQGFDQGKLTPSEPVAKESFPQFRSNKSETLLISRARIWAQVSSKTPGTEGFGVCRSTRNYSGAIILVVIFLTCAFVFIHALSESTKQFGDLFGSEEQQDNAYDENQARPLKPEKTGEWIIHERTGVLCCWLW